MSSNSNPVSSPQSVPSRSPSAQKSQLSMSNETYLNHPTFGLLYRICLIEDSRELFATLYAQRLFFIVQSAKVGFQFDPIGRSDARLLVENRLRTLRRSGQYEDYSLLQATHKQTFQ
ncbi:MAG: PipX family protein [Elainellaceae cyanobacterium]